jgi:hypothetical protein
VPEHLRGTYLGIASDPIVDHLLGLGITAIELMPVHQFIERPRVASGRGSRQLHVAAAATVAATIAPRQCSISLRPTAPLPVASE